MYVMDYKYFHFDFIVTTSLHADFRKFDHLTKMWYAMKGYNDHYKKEMERWSEHL